MITYFGPAADSVIDGNLQIQTTGLSLSAQYDPWYVNGAGVRQPQSIQFFTEVRDNVISGSFRENTQMGSTITLFSFIDQATGWPPVIASTPDQITMAFGVNVAHNDLDETSSRSVDVNGTPSSIFISNIGQATGPTPGYVDTLVFGNNIVSSDPRASGIMNGDLPQYDANTPLRTMFCANTVANATPYSDPNNSAIYCPPTP